MWFAKIFSHSVCSIFILIVSFTVWKLLNVMQFYVLIFAFVFLCFWPKHNSKKFFSMLSSRIFMVSALMFKFPVIYFKLIFVSGMRLGSSFIVLHMLLQFSQHHLLKRLSFPLWVFLAPLSNSS